jgi:hypothetical protein
MNRPEVPVSVRLHEGLSWMPYTRSYIEWVDVSITRPSSSMVYSGCQFILRVNPRQRDNLLGMYNNPRFRVTASFNGDQFHYIALVHDLLMKKAPQSMNTVRSREYGKAHTQPMAR